MQISESIASASARALPGLGWPRRLPRPRAPLAIWLPASAVGLAMLLPLAYLLVRGAGASQEAWELVFRLRTAQILGRSLLLVTTVTSVSLALALPLAWLTTRSDLPLRRMWTVLTVLPLVIPSYVGAFLVISALGPKGLLQGFLAVPFGVDRLPEIYGLPGATLTLGLLTYPYVLLTTRGVLRDLDPSLEESARGLGHGWRSIALRVILPQMRPALVAGSLLVALYTLSDFGAVSLMRYETFSWAIYQQYESAFDRSIAAVLSLVLVALAMGLLVVGSLNRGRHAQHRMGPGVAGSARAVALGRWRWPALGFCAAVVGIALVMPMSVLVYWLMRGVGSGEPLLVLWGAMRNTLYVSGVTALAAAACSVPVAALLVRYPGVLSHVVERASFMGYALPGVVVALALVFFGANFVRPVYGTIWLVAFAYLVLFFPAALGVARSSLAQIKPSVEEAARGLGHSPLRVMLTVTAPLMRSGLLMGAALVFLLAAKELPATLILGPLGFKTLATAVWSASSEAFFAQAAAPAITLVLLSSLPVTVIIMRERRRDAAAQHRRA